MVRIAKRAGRVEGKRAAAGRGSPRSPAPRVQTASLSTAHLRLTVNGETREVACAPHKTLLEVLREDFALTGTKHGCELGECGTCTVLLDGVPVLSCLVLTLECETRAILTVEGLADGPVPHPLQQAFAELGAAQCGYCTPGILCAAKALLDRDPAPTRARIREALSGNLCRCTGYIKIFEAVELAARRMADPAARPPEETLYGQRTVAAEGD